MDITLDSILEEKLGLKKFIYSKGIIIYMANLATTLENTLKHYGGEVSDPFDVTMKGKNYQNCGKKYLFFQDEHGLFAYYELYGITGDFYFLKKAKKSLGIRPNLTEEKEDFEKLLKTLGVNKIEKDTKIILENLDEAWKMAYPRFGDALFDHVLEDINSTFKKNFELHPNPWSM